MMHSTLTIAGVCQPETGDHQTLDISPFVNEMRYRVIEHAPIRQTRLTQNGLGSNALAGNVNHLVHYVLKGVSRFQMPACINNPYQRTEGICKPDFGVTAASRLER